MRALVMTMAIATRLAAADASGRYVLQGEREVGSELILRPNGQFDYMLVYGAADYSATGTWKQAGQSVVLTTDGNAEPPFRLLKSFLGNSEGTRIWIKAPNGHGVPNIDVEMGGVRARTSADGVAEFEPGTSRGPVKIRIPVYHLDAGPYPLKLTHTDHIFEINGPAITTVRFKDERLVLENGGLLMKFWNPDMPVRYSLVR